MNNRRGYPTIIQAAYLSIGLCVTNFIYLYFGLPLQGGVRTLGVLAILCVLTVLLARILIIRVFRPRLTGLPRQEQLAIISVAGIVGLILLLSNPLGIPQHRLYGFLPEVIQAVLNVITLAITGGMLILIILLGVIGTRRPIYPRFPLVAGFFIAYLLIGLAVYDDYGISVDETIQRQHALISLKYVLSQFDPAFAEVRFPDVQELATYEHRYYGVAFHLPLIITEELLTSIPDSQSLWLFRHYVTFLFFYVGTLAFYRLASEKYDWRFGLLGTILLVTTPRIFAESIYNVKDTTFLSAFTIALYFGFRFWRHKTITSGLLFGIATAFATNVRVIAVFLLVIAIGMVLLDFLIPKTRPGKYAWGSIIATLIAFTFFVIVSAPASWSDPVHFLRDTLLRFSDYDAWNGREMYLGELIRGQNVPWHFIPVWMLITIPLPILFLFIVGVWTTVINLIKNRIGIMWIQEQRENIAFLALTIIPIATVIILQSTLYTGWRHLTFVYSPLLLVAMVGGQLLVKQYRSLPSATLQKWIITLMFVWMCLYQVNIVRWITINHPHQTVYFNDGVIRLFGGRDHFERDYLRVSVRSGLEYILAQDSRETINVASITGINDIIRGKYILEPNNQPRIRPNEVADLNADYIIVTYRYLQRFLDIDQALYSIVIDGLPILTIYRYQDLLSNIFVEDNTADMRLELKSYPFFVSNLEGNNSPLSLAADGSPIFCSSRLQIHLPMDAVTKLGNQVKFSVRHSNAVTSDIRRIGCNGQEISQLTVDNQYIEFNLTIKDPFRSILTCTLRFETETTLYGAVVMAADALPQDD